MPLPLAPETLDFLQQPVNLFLQVPESLLSVSRATNSSARPGGGDSGPLVKSGFSAMALVRRLVTLWTSKWVSPAGPVSVRPVALTWIARAEEGRKAILHVGRPVEPGAVV